jgi:hypothetical protein
MENRFAKEQTHIPLKAYKYRPYIRVDTKKKRTVEGDVTISEPGRGDSLDTDLWKEADHRSMVQS